PSARRPTAASTVTRWMRQRHYFFYQGDVLRFLETFILHHHGVKSQLDRLLDLREIVRFVEQESGPNRRIAQSESNPCVEGQLFRLRPRRMPQKAAVETGDDRRVQFFGRGGDADK